MICFKFLKRKENEETTGMKIRKPKIHAIKFYSLLKSEKTIGFSDDFRGGWRGGGGRVEID